MIAAILLSLLFIAAVSAAFIFIFSVLSPALKLQNVPLDRPIFSESEVRVKPSSVEQFARGEGNVAAVMCSFRKDVSAPRYNYEGQKSCALFNSLLDSGHDCKWGCIGFGDCVSSCSRRAIQIVNSCAVVNSLCNGCGKCVPACPKALIRLVPLGAGPFPACAAPGNDGNSCSCFGKASDAGAGISALEFWKGVRFRLKGIGS